MSADTAMEVGRLFKPISQIANTLVASQRDVFIRLPGLVAYWPMGIKFLDGDVAEHSGTSFSLAQVGLCPTGYDGNAFTHLGNGVNYLTAPAPFDITGLETFITPSLRGLTMGGWFMFDATPAANSGIMTKDKLSPNRGYTMTYHNTNTVRFHVSGNGASIVSVISQTAPLSIWHFCVARFIPSTEIATFVDGDKSTNTSVIPASLNVSTQAFEVGRQFNTDSLTLHGKARDAFICASALSDQIIEEVRTASAP